MGLLAGAHVGELASAWAAIARQPAYRVIRAPETGLVMLRGRAGGGGKPFNLGEATVTRAVVALETGETGFAYALGRDKKKALFSALFDALWQRADHRDAVETLLARPLAEARRKADAETKSETTATRVDFFTMVRGED
ncbi:phosphonate C-P lyase system protein PhnG [Stappia sp. F7233]|uniref:Phosphonate C-P lyase system protein PhnG n=2 Tax=Stappia albiluteola TaxID=2758565 RepID=A0A839AKH7_9HYPH|nr:phosphonate C-P lyase system protein PhnG [Stappia albiluteola]